MDMVKIGSFSHENESLYRALLTVDKRTLQIVLLKMQGYSTKEIASLVGLTTGAVYARLDHLRKYSIVIFLFLAANSSFIGAFFDTTGACCAI